MCVWKVAETCWKWHCKAIFRILALPMQSKRPALEPSHRQGTNRGTAEPNVLQQTTDENLVALYLDLCRRGKRGSATYQTVEAEMRARNLIRQNHWDTDYTSSRSSFAPRSSMFSSFR